MLDLSRPREVSHSAVWTLILSNATISWRDADFKITNTTGASEQTRPVFTSLAEGVLDAIERHAADHDASLLKQIPRGELVSKEAPQSNLFKPVSLRFHAPLSFDGT